MLVVHKHNTTVSIQCSSDIADDVITILEKLLSISKTFKIKMRIADAEKKAEDPARRQMQEEQYNKHALSVYRKYEKRKGQGLKHSQIVKSLKIEFDIGYYETEIAVTSGRQIQKELINNQIVDGHFSGDSLKLLATRHKLTERTIKRIIRSHASQIKKAR